MNKLEPTLALEHFEMVRPGRRMHSLLVVLHNFAHADATIKMLKANFSSARGSVEEALEDAIKRVNVALADREIAGSIIALACEEGQFAAASGGEAVAHCITSNTSADISPTPTPVTRAKLFAAFAAGTSGAGGSCIISLRRLKADELVRVRTVQGGTKRVQLVTVGVVRVSPFARASFAHASIRFGIVLRNAAKTLVRRDTWTRAGALLLFLVRNPKHTVTFISVTFPLHLRRVVRWFQRITPKKRAGALAALLAVFMVLHVFFSALGARNVEEIIAETLKRESRIAELIQQKKETQALTLLDETLILLSKAPIRLNDTQKETLLSLQARLLRMAAELNKVSIIPSPQPVVSMEKSFREARRFDLSGLALAGARLYTVNRAEKEVYELDGRERRIVVIKDFPQGAGAPVGIVSAVPGYVFVLTENPRGLLTLNTEKRAFTFSPLVLPRADALPITFAAYNQRIYMLDARARAIYRYELTSQGYNLWSPWTDETSLDFSQATTFAIDGSIYVTFSDHDIVRLVQGKRQPFPIDTIRPPLEKVTAIATKEDSPFLYLLDPPQRRVVIIKKDDGSLVAQYTSPLLTDLRGLFPDEAAKRIYLLNGDTIYSVGPDDETVTDLQ